ncbi:MAG: DUF4258 domain-containing protein [Chloroflexi bacterium]|nr:DUF4258 domain-containing protein [Chloroflexota bacterium]
MQHDDSQFYVTDHARDQIDRREIPSRLLSETIANPQQIVPGYEGLEIYQSQLDFGEGRIYLLRVVVNSSAQPIRIVTVYKTSKIAQYWRYQE